MAGLVVAQAASHALRKALDESDWPPDLAPKRRILYVIVADDMDEFKRKNRSRTQRKDMVLITMLIRLM